MPRKPEPPHQPTPRSQPPRAYHHGDLHNELLRVALGLVEQHGVEAFSLREAAAQCGVAVSSAYKHFASRSDLLAAVADLGFEALADRMERRVRSATARLEGTAPAETALVILGATYIRFAIERANLFRLMYGPREAHGGTAAPARHNAARRIGLLLMSAIDEVCRAYGHDAAWVAARREVNMTTAWALVHGFAVMVVDGVWVTPSQRALDAMIAELGQAALRSLR